jgi:hypothetical protein
MKVASEKRRLLTGDDSSFVSWVGKSPEVIAAAFQDFLKTAAPQQALAFRNKTDLTVEGMARILDDYKRLHRIAGEQKPPQEKQ